MTVASEVSVSSPRAAAELANAISRFSSMNRTTRLPALPSRAWALLNS
jgi:hypothetical protein